MMIVNKAPGVGDAVCLTPLIREIRRRYPKEVITVQSAHSDLFVDNPHLDDPLLGFDNFLPTAVLSPATLPTHYETAPLAVAYGAYLGMTVVDPTPEVFIPPEMRKRARDVMMSRAGEKKVVAIDMGASWTARQWPLERWRELVEKLQASGFFIVKVGEPVVDEAGNTRSDRFFGDWNLYNTGSPPLQTATTISGCDLYIGSDSGSFHLAAAVGVPQVVFFTARSAASLRSYWNTIPLYSLKACNASCHMKCVQPATSCLKDISVDDALQGVRVLIQRFRQDEPMEASETCP